MALFPSSRGLPLGVQPGERTGEPRRACEQSVSREGPVARRIRASLLGKRCPREAGEQNRGGTQGCGLAPLQQRGPRRAHRDPHPSLSLQPLRKEGSCWRRGAGVGVQPWDPRERRRRQHKGRVQSPPPPRHLPSTWRAPGTRCRIPKAPEKSN